MDQPLRGPLTLNGHVQGVEDDLGVQSIAHRPVDNPAGEHVEDDGEVEPIFAGGDVR